MEQCLERRPSGPRALAAGLAVGAVAMAWADTRPGARSLSGPRARRRPRARYRAGARPAPGRLAQRRYAHRRARTRLRPRGRPRPLLARRPTRDRGRRGAQGVSPKPTRLPAGRGSRARRGRGSSIPIDARLGAVDPSWQACAGAVAVRALPRGAGAGRGGLFGLGVASDSEADRHRLIHGEHASESDKAARRNATIHAKSSYDPSMAMTSARRDPVSQEHRRSRALLGAGMTLVLIVVLLAVAVLAFSGVTLASDSTALARVTVQPLGGTIERVQAYGPERSEGAADDRRWAADSAEAADSGRAGDGGRARFAGRGGSAGRWGASATSN